MALRDLLGFMRPADIRENLNAVAIHCGAFLQISDGSGGQDGFVLLFFGSRTKPLALGKGPRRPDRFPHRPAPASQGRCDENYRQMIRYEVDRAEALFRDGDPLLPLLRPAVRKHITLFAQGGRAILDAIRRQHYDTLTHRPSLSKWQKGRLLCSALTRHFMCFLLPGGRA
ncbi:MAG TPA: squalene/phytoene synthase family protein, partial [Tepidisphaeraceae bacterium]|nr:squalene/phytoene synthase family protein [Tepidisphaeraceae bacterium]